MTTTHCRELLDKYLSQMTDAQITCYLSWVGDQDTVEDAQLHYPDDVRTQLQFYLSYASDSCIEASLEWIIDSWCTRLFRSI